MNQYCTETKKVRDFMTVVATEGFNSLPKFSTDILNKFFPGLESNSQTNLNDITHPQIGSNGNNHSDQKNNTKDVNKVQSDKYKPDYEDVSFGKAEVVNVSPDVPLPSGRVLSIDMNILGKRFNFNMYVNFATKFIHSDVVNQFVALNFTPSFKQRVLQAKTGEIRAFYDLILCQDIRKQRFDALKHDKSGVLQDMIDRQRDSLANSWLKLSTIEKERQNIANTILVFDKMSFAKACSDAGIKFDKYEDRQKFFVKSFCMMVAVVDTMYNRVTLYYHSLRGSSEFTFEQLKKSSKSNAKDIIDIMKSFGGNLAPRF
jgi:hypothetical protein